eukprot:TRINITY_DN29130_c0_g1_i1.p1 TRINITY_DN29130_c0_g1~~TRINITY_DN29130_c0_g1_i1.p1  ORF type:complete len:852 (+),score=217.22 TRINITY_DN29130_c0_g1_i1:233-2788(+)
MTAMVELIAASLLRATGGGKTATVRELKQVLARLRPKVFTEEAVASLLEHAGQRVGNDEDGLVCVETFCAFLFDACLGDSNRGVSVRHLRDDLLALLHAAGHERSARVYEVEATVIRPKGARVRCPHDGCFGAAYVDGIFGPKHSGVANFMLSYTWGYEVGDIIDTLVDFCTSKELAVQETYVWICCLCINQHRVKEAQERGDVVPFATFEYAFAERVRSIGHVIAMMAPWNNPRYITRVWCDFEMFTAATMPNCSVTIVMPPREAQSLHRELLHGEGLQEVWRCLSGLSVESAEASIKSDQELILKLIRENIGYHRLNTTIAEHLKAWMLSACEGQLLRSLAAGELENEPAACLCNEVGRLLLDSGLLDRAAALLDEGLRLREASSTLSSHEGAALLSNRGLLLHTRGDIDGAMGIYDRARCIFDALGTLVSPEGAKLLCREGKAKGERGDTEGKLRLYLEARRIHEETHTLRTHDGAGLLSNIGAVKRQKGQFSAAVKVYQEALDIYEEGGTAETPAGATLLSNMGYAYFRLRKLDQAQDSYERSRRIREKTGTMVTPAGAMLLTNMADVLEQRNADDEGYLQLLWEARRVREETGTLETVPGAILLSHLGKRLLDKGDAAVAAEQYERARLVREKTQTLATEDGAKLLAKLADAHVQTGDSNGGLALFLDAISLREATQTLQSEAGARLLLRLAETYFSQGDLASASSSLGEAKKICESQRGSKKLVWATLLEHIGDTELKFGIDPGCALATWIAAKDVRSQLGKLETSKGAELLEKIVSATRSVGGDSAAIDELEATLQKCKQKSSLKRADSELPGAAGELASPLLKREESELLGTIDDAGATDANG